MNFREAMESQFSEESEALKKAREEFSEGSWVYLNVTKQLGVVKELKDSPDGVLVRVANIGLVPINELRKGTEEEIKNWLDR